MMKMGRMYISGKNCVNWYLTLRTTIWKERKTRLQNGDEILGRNWRKRIGRLVGISISMSINKRIIEIIITERRKKYRQM